MDARKRPRYILSAVHTFCHFIIDTIESGERVLVSHIKNQVIPLINYLSNYLAGRIDKRESVDVDTLHSIEAALQNVSEEMWELRVLTTGGNEDEDKVAILRALRVIRLALKMPEVAQTLTKSMRALYDILEQNGLFADAQNFADEYVNEVLGNAEDKQEDAGWLWRELKSSYRALQDNEPSVSKLTKQIDKAFEQKKKKSGGQVKLFFEKGITDLPEYDSCLVQIEWWLLKHTSKPVGNAQAAFKRAPILEHSKWNDAVFSQDL